MEWKAADSEFLEDPSYNVVEHSGTTFLKTGPPLCTYMDERRNMAEGLAENRSNSLNEINFFEDLSIFNLTTKFTDDVACQQFAEDFGLLPKKSSFDGRPCPTPGCGKILSVCNGDTNSGWRIRCKGRKRRMKDGTMIAMGCGKSWNPCEKSLFEKSKLPLPKIFIIMYCWVIGINLDMLISELRISTETAGYWFRFCREVATKSVTHSSVIGGAEQNIEIDEYHFYSPKYNCGRRNPSAVWVIGGMSRETGHIFLERLKIRDKMHVHDVIRRRVSSYSTVHTDCWQEYNGINEPYDASTGFGCGVYKHFVVNHNKEFAHEEILEQSKGPENALQTKVTNKQFEHLWKQVRKHVKCGRSYINDRNEKVEHIVSYLDSFIYFNNILKPLKRNGQKFKQFLNDVKVCHPPLLYTRMLQAE